MRHFSKITICFTASSTIASLLAQFVLISTAVLANGEMRFSSPSSFDDNCDRFIANVSDKVTFAQVQEYLTPENQVYVSKQIQAFRTYAEGLAQGRKMNSQDISDYTRAAAIYGFAEELSSTVREQNDMHEYIADPSLKDEAHARIEDLRQKVLERLKRLKEALQETNAAAKIMPSKAMVDGLVDEDKVLKDLAKHGVIARERALDILNKFSNREISGELKVHFKSKYRFFGFGTPSGQYRICVEILEDIPGARIKFLVHRIGPHENFYEHLDRLRY